MRPVVRMLIVGLTVTMSRIAIADEHPPVRIASCNICWGNQNIPLMVQAIRDAKAVVICLQETNRTSESAIRQELKSLYPVMRFSGHKGRWQAERFGIHSRYPVSQYWFHPPAGLYFGFVTCRVQLPSTSIDVFNVHLAPFTLHRVESLSDVMKQLTRTEIQHQKEIENIQKRISADQPTVVAGDFNSLTGFCAPRRMDAMGFEDSCRSVHGNVELHPTWFWPLRTGQTQLRIDYLFHSRHFRARKFQVSEIVASDHRLIIAELHHKAD